MSDAPKIVVPPKPLHDQVDFSNELPDRFKSKEERYFDDDEGAHWEQDRGPIFGFEE